MSARSTEVAARSEEMAALMRRPKPTLDARGLTLVERVAEALAAYHGQQLEDVHRRQAAKLMRAVLRREPRRQPDAATLIV